MRVLNPFGPKIAVTKTRPSSGVNPTMDMKGSSNFAKNSIIPEISKILTIKTKGIKIYFRGYLFSRICPKIFIRTS